MSWRVSQAQVRPSHPAVALALALCLALCGRVSSVFAQAPFDFAGAGVDTARVSGLDLSGLPSPDLGGMVLKLVLALLVVLALILVLQRMARRWGRNLGGSGAVDDIRVLAQRALGPRTTLMVVEVLGQRFLIGMSPQGVHRVAELGEVDLYETAAAAAPGTPVTRPAPEVPRDEAAIGFAAQLRERLQSLRSLGAPQAADAVMEPGRHADGGPAAETPAPRGSRNVRVEGNRR